MRRSGKGIYLSLCVVVFVCAKLVWGGGHQDMFACRSKACPVVELTDSNYDAKTSAEPHLIMYYAVWCGHCKSLAPKWKKAAKELEKFGGVKMGAVNVEDNRNVQSKYPDIRGFPTIKFVYGNKAEDYNGPRETDDLVTFAKERAKKFGALVEPVASKSFDELYTFFGRAALDNKPALLLVGKNPKTPDWFSTMHGKLKATSVTSPDAEAKEKLEEAILLAKTNVLRDGIQSVLDDLESREKGSAKPKFSAAYSNDPATLEAFHDSTLYIAFVDRKNMAHSRLCAMSVTGTQKAQLQDLTTWAKSIDTSTDCESLESMPELPKPASVLAAEERAARKKAQASSVNAITSPDELSQKCYQLDKSTCALILISQSQKQEPLDALAAKYARNGFQFSTLDTSIPPSSLLAELNPASGQEPALIIIKGGKRPRAARAFGLDSFDKLLDDVLAGGAKFDKFSSGGLPLWPQSESDDSPPAEDDSDYEL